MTEHAGFTQPVGPNEHLRRLRVGLADADKHLAHYMLMRDEIVDELTAMGEI